MKRVLFAAIAASTLLSATAMAQSAKFTAVYNDSIDSTFVLSESCAATDDGTYCGATGAADENSVLSGFAKIRVPQAKELLVGLSAQVALGTYTEAKGKKGSYSIATAFAEGGVTLYACTPGDTTMCYEGKPGYVALNNREQELEAILGGVIESCVVDVTVDFINETASGSFSLSDCNVLDEMIALGVTTMSAHHFNFLFPNLPQGDYEIVAKFETETEAAADASCAYETEYPDLCDTGDGSAKANAWAYIGKWMMTVQTVRAVKDENGDPDVVIDIE